MTHLVTKKQPAQHCDKCNKYFADLEVLTIAIIFLLIKLILTFLKSHKKYAHRPSKKCPVPECNVQLPLHDPKLLKMHLDNFHKGWKQPE